LSGKWHGGKGSFSRTKDHEKYRDNFDKIFNKPSQPVDSKQENNLK